MSHDLNKADIKILTKLTEGRNLPQNIANDFEYTRQYIHNRLQMLSAAGYVENIGGGLYELTDDGRTALGQEGGDNEE